MKALAVIASIFVVALILRIVEVFACNKRIHSVGAMSNKESSKIPTLNINDPEELKEALKQYKDLDD